MAPPQPIVPLQRCLLLPVDDSDDSQRAFDWIIKNFYKPGDEVHLLNVISRMQFAATLGVPAVDFTPQINREAYEAAVRKAEAFIVKRFLARMPPEIQTTPIVHIIKVGMPTCSTPCRESAFLSHLERRKNIPVETRSATLQSRLLLRCVRGLRLRRESQLGLRLAPEPPSASPRSSSLPMD